MKAKTTRRMFSRETEVAIDIRADASTVWALPTDAAAYPTWSSTVIALEGDIALGQKIKLRSTLDPKRTFKLTVEAFDRFAADLKQRAER